MRSWPTATVLICLCVGFPIYAYLSPLSVTIVFSKRIPPAPCHLLITVQFLSLLSLPPGHVCKLGHLPCFVYLWIGQNQ